MNGQSLAFFRKGAESAISLSALKIMAFFGLLMSIIFLGSAYGMELPAQMSAVVHTQEVMCVQSNFRLGEMLLKSDGYAQDYTKGRYYLLLAAAQESHKLVKTWANCMLAIL